MSMAEPHPSRSLSERGTSETKRRKPPGRRCAARTRADVESLLHKSAQIALAASSPQLQNLPRSGYFDVGTPRHDGLMTDLADALAELGDVLAGVVVAEADGLRSAGEAEVLTVLAAAGRLVRLAQALMVEATAVVLERDDSVPHSDRLTTRYGCRHLGELLQRATRVSGRTASDVVGAAKAVRRQVAPSTGEVLPAEFHAMREALRAGDAGLDGLVAVAGAFSGSLIGGDALWAADDELAAAARGVNGPVSADELRAMAQV